MLKQTSGTGLSANYYLKQELNKFTDGDLEVTNPSNEGKSIAKVTKKLTIPEITPKTLKSILKSKDSARDRNGEFSMFTAPKIIKSKGSAIKRDEKKQIRKAGREAAKNAEVDFVKATPMGSDYFSLMAATAENLASRGAGKRKARKEAKDLKRKDLREVKPIESKGFQEITKDESKDKLEDTKVPKNATEVVPLNRTYEEPKKQNKQETKEEPKNNMNTKFIENITELPQMLPNGLFVRRNKGNKKTVTPQGDKNTENLDSKYYYSDETRKYSVKINPKTGKEYIERNLSPASKAVNKTITDAIGSISSILTKPFSNEAVAERKAKLEQTRQEREQRQKERELDLEKIKQIQGLPMMGDGFNKGMSRKNKYKK